jgi:hypothetical protein
MYTSEHNQPVVLPVTDTVHPVVAAPGTTLHTRPQHPVPLHPVPLHPVPLHPVPLHPVPQHPVPLHPVPQHPVPLHPVPQHPHGVVDLMEMEKHEGVKLHVFHQTVTLKIETTAFGIDAHQGSERSS